MAGAGPAGSIGDVVGRLEALDAALPTPDGLAWFNKLYLEMTRAVLAALERDLFEDPRFMERLDVLFANLYFTAVAEDAGGRTPRAWVPLLDARARRTIAPIQFALAGINAHINRDLPVAVVETCRELRIEPDRARYRDYARINGILEETQERVKIWFATGFTEVADVVFGRVDEVVSTWSLTKAREAAWINGETLWFLRDLPELSSSYLLTLDRMVGFAGRGLLIPTAV